MNLLPLLSLAIMAQATDAPALKGHDPVALCRGVEKPGNPKISTTYRGYRYQFASEANRATFLKDPERWAIQFDGACMKMGPTSGKGSPTRYAVHDGHIYVFASDSCYQWFVLDPEKYIDRPEVFQPGSAESVKLARQWLDKAVKFSGGADRLKKLQSLQIVTSYATAAEPEKETHTITRTWTSWGHYKFHWKSPEYQYGSLVTPKKSWSLYSELEESGPSTHAWSVRSKSHEPLMLLAAHLKGELQMKHLGVSSDREGVFHRVQVFAQGALTTLAIDAGSGKIRSAEYVGRSGPGVASILKHFKEYRSVSGYQLPSAVTTVIGGQREKDPLATIKEIKINGTFPDGFWTPVPMK